MITWYAVRRWWALRKARAEARYWFEIATEATACGDLEAARRWRRIGFQILHDEFERWPTWEA